METEPPFEWRGKTVEEQIQEVYTRLSIIPIGGIVEISDQELTRKQEDGR